MRTNIRHLGPWKDHSDGATIRFVFAPPRHWHAQRLAAECAAIVDALVAVQPVSDATPATWLALMRALPASLRAALILELLAGNCITTIACPRPWRRSGVVVTLRDRFQPSSRGLAPQLCWRAVDSAQDGREALSQQGERAEFQLLAAGA